MIREFVNEHVDTVIKPLGQHGWFIDLSAERVDPNRNAIMDAVTRGGSSQTMRKDTFRKSPRATNVIC